MMFLRLLIPWKPWLELTQGWAGLKGPLELGGMSEWQGPAHGRSRAQALRCHLGVPSVAPQMLEHTRKTESDFY